MMDEIDRQRLIAIRKWYEGDQDLVNLQAPQPPGDNRFSEHWVDFLLRMLTLASCGWCGWTISRTEEKWEEKLAGHLGTCVEHPLKGIGEINDKYLNLLVGVAKSLSQIAEATTLDFACIEADETFKRICAEIEGVKNKLVKEGI